MGRDKLILSIKLLQFFHGIIIILWIAFLFGFIFFSGIRTTASIYFILVGAPNIFLSTCPLTILEKRLLKKARIKNEAKNFTPRFFKKYFGFEISYKFVNFLMMLALCIAIIYLIF